jgi:tetratricopeptide (TPR) repeat protein
LVQKIPHHRVKNRGRFGRPGGSFRLQSFPFRRFALLWIGALILAGCVSGPRGLSKDAAPPIPLPEDTLEPLGSLAGQRSASLSLARRGRDLLDQGRTDEAISVLEKAIVLHPSNPYAYYFMARARFIQNETGQALALLAKAEIFFRDTPPWLSRVYLLRGEIDETLSRPEDARKQYRAALAADPHNQQASDRIGRLDGNEFR